MVPICGSIDCIIAANFSHSACVISFQEEYADDCLPALVHSFTAVLAPGPARSGPVSHCVAAITALPPGRHSRSRSLGAGVGCGNASRTPTERAFSSFKGPNASYLVTWRHHSNLLTRWCF